MTLVRNISDQAFILNCKGSVIQLFPRRAATVPDETLKSSQVQNLLQKGFVRFEKIDKQTAEKDKKAGRDKTAREKQGNKSDEKKPDDK